MGIWDDIKKTFRNGSNLTRLIYLNIAFFILITVFAVIGFLLNNPVISEKTLSLLSVPSSYKAFLLRPWTIITYMFVHKDIWHILFNMLWLYWFGRIFLEYLDQRKLVAVYLMGGISGAIIYILSFNIFPAFTGNTIHLFLFGRIKIKYMALTIFVLTSIMDFSVNSGGKLAHIGGALFGYLYIINLRKGRDIGRGFNKIIDFIVVLFKPRPKLKVTHKRVVNEYEYNKARAEHQVIINNILEKISKGGYDSLTKEEKDTLFKESQRKN